MDGADLDRPGGWHCWTRWCSRCLRGWSGAALSFAAGGIPPFRAALADLWRRRVLDIDLLMVIAALAAASVGAGLEGAGLLALFSLSGMPEHRGSIGHWARRGARWRR